jgi:hypothetical protein
MHDIKFGFRVLEDEKNTEKMAPEVGLVFRMPISRVFLSKLPNKNKLINNY